MHSRTSGRTRIVGAVTAVAFTATGPAKAAICDLSPVSVRKHFQSSIPLGLNRVDTDTYVQLQFTKTAPGVVKITRREDNYLPNLTQVIAAEIAKFDAQLPKNDCNSYARVSSQNAAVTGSTFTISVSISGNIWACTPKKVPCPGVKIDNVPLKLNELLPNSPKLESARWNGTVRQGDLVEERDSLLAPIGFSLPNPFNPPPPPNPFKPPPPPVPLPHSVPVPVPEVKMCDVPGVKTKGPGGSVSQQYVLSGTHDEKEPKVTSTKQPPQTHLDAGAQFLLGLLGDLGFLAKLGIDGAIQNFAKRNLDVVPNEITLPDGRVTDLDWTVRSASFSSGNYVGSQVPDFVVTRDYEGPEGTVCVYRRTMIELR